MAELLVDDERRLGAGADVNPAVVSLPGDRTMGFQMDMLDSRRRVGHFVNGVSRRESILDATDLAMDFGIDITLRFRPFIVEDRGIWTPSRPGGRKQRAALRSRPGLPGMRLLQPPSLSATTATTRWPTKRTTLSRT